LRTEEGASGRTKETVPYRETENKKISLLKDRTKNQELTPTKHNPLRINAHRINNRVMSAEIEHKSAVGTFPLFDVVATGGAYMEYQDEC
jgi:hypothetical protein